MKRLVLPCLLLIALLVAAQNAPKKSNTAGKKAAPAAARHEFTTADMQYGPPPPFVPPGAQIAVLEGNPAGTSGDYTIRAKMPDGYVIGPHFHPKRENVTIISGALKLGMGDKMDEGSMKPYNSGDFFYMDPSMHHYVKVQGETVIQVHGAAPLAFTYINKEDDPRNKK